MRITLNAIQQLKDHNPKHFPYFRVTVGKNNEPTSGFEFNVHPGEFVFYVDDDLQLLLDQETYERTTNWVILGYDKNGYLTFQQLKDIVTKNPEEKGAE